MDLPPSYRHDRSRSRSRKEKNSEEDVRMEYVSSEEVADGEKDEHVSLLNGSSNGLVDRLEHIAANRQRTR